MTQIRDPFLREIEVYLKNSGVSASRLGRDVLHDPAFVTQVRNGRQIRPSTREKLRKHMATNAG